MLSLTPWFLVAGVAIGGGTDSIHDAARRGELGVVREMVLASQVGAGAEVDAYRAAFQIPDILPGSLVIVSEVFPLIVVGAKDIFKLPLLHVVGHM